MADTTDESHPAHLPPSQLGTKDYWETFYARTLTHISTKQPAITTGTAVNPIADPDTNSESEHAAGNSDDDDEYADDDSDPGTSWFSEHNAPDKVLRFLTRRAFPLAPCNTLRGGRSQAQSQSQPSILDLGTGNGSMLALLRKRGGFRGDMVGVDYSARSVELARELQRLRIHSAYLSCSESGSGSESETEYDPETEGQADGEGEDEDEDEGKSAEIRFEEWDILGSGEDLDSDSTRGRLGWFPYEKGGFDIVLDKGTFDAISLSDETVGGGEKSQQRVCERYPGIARKLVRKGGFLVVTSCNWTEEELIRWFTRAENDALDKLVVWGKVEYPRFRFGGQEGQGVCTVCFQRVDSS